MFKILLTLTFSFSLFIINAQEVHQKRVFNILETGTKYSSELLINSLTNADWCGFYYSSERHVLKFDDGSVAELFSFSELKVSGVILDQGCEMVNGGVDEATYSIANNGFIVRTSNKKITK